MFIPLLLLCVQSMVCMHFQDGELKIISKMQLEIRIIPRCNLSIFIKACLYHVVFFQTSS